MTTPKQAVEVVVVVMMVTIQSTLNIVIEETKNAPRVTLHEKKRLERLFVKRLERHFETPQETLRTVFERC